MKLSKLKAYILILLIFPLFVYSQNREDSTTSVNDIIEYYDCFNDVLGGDSTRLTKNKPCQGWIKDHYPNGQIKHNGLYEKGKLTAYKNFYINGNIERAFVKKDSKKSQLEIFYNDGIKRTEAVFYFTTPVKWIDFYPDGTIESIEEYNKSLDYYLQHKFFFNDGKPHIILDLIDKKTKIYNYKEYFSSGQINEEGQKIYNKTTGDYPRIGTWNIYDESGKLIRREIYNKGVLISEELY